MTDPILSPVDPGSSPKTGFPTIPVLVAILAIGWILAGFFGYSWKKTVDHQSNTDTSHSEAVTIKVPMEVGGKVVYKTLTKTVHDQAQTVVHDHSETVIKSGVGIGVAMSLKGNPGFYLNPDLFPLGPGNLQAMGFYSNGEVWGGLAYRLNF